MEFTPNPLPIKKELETKKVLKKTISANRALARLNGVAKIIPNSHILINSLVIEEAKDSSEIENIITTHDELYRAGVRRQSGTNLKNAKTGEVIFTPPQDYETIQNQLETIHPYTKIDFLVDRLGITRKTASKYLKELESIGVLEITQIKNSKFFINIGLFALLKKGL